MDQTEIDKLAKIIWDYHSLKQQLEKADCILVLCSNDIRVAEKAANLFLKGWAPLLLITGGISHQDDLLAEPWDIPPANKFAEIAIERGVPAEKILIENKSTNTGENILFTKRLLKQHGLDPRKYLVVQKSYMERRALAALKKQWPENEFTITSPDTSFEEYPDDAISKDVLINLMVGDLQRIKVYPDKGFQIYQEIPENVWDAYEKLVGAGYTQHLIKS